MTMVITTHMAMITPIMTIAMGGMIMGITVIRTKVSIHMHGSRPRTVSSGWH
ncbi:hypothetical protein GCM10007921_39750 [Tritonibacter mobilis]|nr:hypothetical protein GCM10007921_39750 [Tritonibacter mobilis]